MNVPLVLLNRRRQGGAFSPTRLFALAEPGVWYDPSALTTLFQDTAGTTPVTTPGQTVALALDKSKGLVLGSELVTNGDFSSGTGWTLFGAGLSITGGKLVFNSAGSTQYAWQAVLTVGKTYQVTFTVSDYSVGGVRVAAGGTNGISRSANGTFTEYVQCTTNTNFYIITATASNTLNVDNVTVKELPGFHATQSSSSFRPAYQTTPQRFNFDGSDDRLVFTYNPTTSGSLAVRINGSTASRVAIGSQGATDGRCFIGLASDGSLAAGIGTQTTATIKGSTDIRSTWTTGVVTWDGTTVRLYQNGTEVYSGAQSGAVNTTVPFDLGCLNNNGTRAAFWGGGIGAAIALGRVMTPAEITSLHQFWSNIA